MSISTNPTSRSNDEIDLIPLIQALWTNKTTVLATTIAGAVIAFSLCAVSPEQWTASTYLSKSSLFNLYKEVKGEEGPSPASEPLLYTSIQNDIFYAAMGVMVSQSISVKETSPKTGKNEPVLYIASATAPTAEQASARLNAALDTASNEAIALNLPALVPESGVRAFNTLNGIKTVNIKNTTKLTGLGAFLGLLLGSAFIVGRFLLRAYKTLPTS